MCHLHEISGITPFAVDEDDAIMAEHWPIIKSCDAVYLALRFTKKKEQKNQESLCCSILATCYLKCRICTHIASLRFKVKEFFADYADFCPSPVSSR